MKYNKETYKILNVCETCKNSNAKFVADKSDDWGGEYKYFCGNKKVLPFGNCKNWNGK